MNSGPTCFILDSEKTEISHSQQKWKIPEQIQIYQMLGVGVGVGIPVALNKFIEPCHRIRTEAAGSGHPGPWW